MFQKILDQPWISLAFVAIIAILWLAATIRVKRDRMFKHRAKVNRRDRLRAERDRRWKARPDPRP